MKKIEELKQIVKSKGLKYTKQREIVFETILKYNNHLSAEDIYNILNKEYPNMNIGIATIYRALAFLEEVNLISSIAINKDGKKFESNDKQHHDHLVCIKCNKIIEFVDDDIEQKQKQIANDFGFKLLDHTMYLYGICENCQ
jgi:Fur family ferric uptake transcriptional regulator